MRNFFTRLLLVAVCCTAFMASRAQPKKYPSTLLWRISGKGLAQPSYLFGTMHVTDRSVFYFSDSLYKCLEKSAGYAMELDPDTAVSALFRSIFSEDTTGFVKDAVDGKEFSRMAKRLESELGIPAGRVTKKQLWLYSFKGGRDKKEDDMDSPVDTYLYNIAKRQGKWVGGIEDLEDQMNLLEELGSKFDADALLYKAKNKAALEKITAIYKEQDLDKIADWTGDTDSLFRDHLLNRRNIKMARRIDSMAMVRNMFFAVGAAHLPGRAGLITLLRSRGYTVEPIVSANRIAPEAYTYKAVDIPWQTINDEDKTYTVQMPGKAVPLKLPGGITMLCYADMGTGLIYFSMVIDYPTLAGNSDSLLSVTAKGMARAGIVGKQEYISYNGTRGVELYADKDKSYYYRIRTFLKGQTMFVVMAGSEKKKLVNSAESDRFFASLSMHTAEHAPVAAGEKWVSFNLPEKSFGLELPGTPEHNKQMERMLRENPSAYGWSFDCYGYSDPSSGNYYMVLVKDTRNGYYLMNDTSAFHDARENTINNGAEMVSCDTLRYEGYAAANMKAVYPQTNLEMLSFTLCRGNRIYMLMGLHEKGKGDTVAIARFLHSFRLMNHLSGAWQEQASPDRSFTAWAPTTIERLHTRDEDTSSIIFSAYDSLSTISYQVQKEALPSYYWTKSDSSLFAYLLSTQYQQWNDSLLLQREVQNGGAKGKEYFFEQPASNNLKRVRILPNADSMYVIFSFAPRQLTQDQHYNRFYESFRIAHEQPAKPWLVNKAEALLKALQSPDSATAADAIAALRRASFEREDLPLLHEALLYPYKEEDSYLLYNNLVKAIAKEKDSSTLSFIAARYPLLSGEKERLKYRLLSVLADIPTAASYTLLQKLLLEQAPKAGDPDLVKYRLTDSLALTAGLFPGLLPMSRDTLFIRAMPYLLMRLADSNLLALSSLPAAYKKDYYAFARRELRRLKTADDDYESQPLIHLLGRLNSTESNTLLQEFLRTKSMDLREEAALALVKNNQPVAPAILEKIAADKSLRVHLYTELVKCKKEKLFPAIYHTQKSFSESELYRAALDNEYDSISIRFVEMRKAMYMGKMQTFYLFNLAYNNEDGQQEGHLSVAGPYTAGGKLVTESDISQIVWDEKYAPNRVTTQFKKVLEDAEKRKKEEAVLPGDITP